VRRLTAVAGRAVLPALQLVEISSNLLRFAPHAYSYESTRHAKPQTDNVVAFVDAGPDALSQVRAQEYGKFFSAQRIVTRVADELDATATL